MLQKSLIWWFDHHKLCKTSKLIQYISFYYSYMQTWDGVVVQWLAVLPHSREICNLITPCACVTFLPQHKDMHAVWNTGMNGLMSVLALGQTGYFTLPLAVWQLVHAPATLNGWLFQYYRMYGDSFSLGFLSKIQITNSRVNQFVF